VTGSEQDENYEEIECSEEIKLTAEEWAAIEFRPIGDDD
jgi:hypothetical protein